MNSYQVIILIGSIIGILVTIGVSFTMGFLSQMENDISLEQDDIRIYGAAVLSFVLYIVILVIALAVKNSKAVGIISIIISIIILIAMGGFGIVGFVLLLVGGIVAITYKDKLQSRNNPDTEEIAQGIEKEERWTFKKAMGIVGLLVLSFFVLFAIVWLFESQLEPQLNGITEFFNTLTENTPSPEQSEEMGREMANNLFNSSSWFK